MPHRRMNGRRRARTAPTCSRASYVSTSTTPIRASRIGFPPDNPFIKTSGVRPEIWAFGFRNPWRMSFDRATGDLWVGDVGWELWEMIHKVKRGGNYGWSVMEGPQPVHVDWKRGPGPILPPTIAHPHSEAASITGGYVYHGARLPELAGAYIYGDYQTGTIWGLRTTGEKITWHQELARSPLHLVAFGESQDGELFLIDHDRTHQIYRLVPNPAAKAKDNFPRRLGETGLFESTRDHRRAMRWSHSLRNQFRTLGRRCDRGAVPGGPRRRSDRPRCPGNWGASRKAPSSREIRHHRARRPEAGVIDVGSNPRSFISRRVRGVPIPTSGTRDSPMPSWSMRRERRKSSRSTIRPPGGLLPRTTLSRLRDRSASSATTPGREEDDGLRRPIGLPPGPTRPR